MKTLIADEGLLALLKQPYELVQIRDAGGRVIGFFATSGPRLDVSDETGKLLGSFVANGAATEAAIKAVPGKKYKSWEVFEHLKAITPNVEMRAHLDKHIEELKARDGCDIP
jgi:hypothetical protein